MWEWLPALQQVLPAAGLTVFNVWACPYSWWVAYVDLTRRAIDLRKG